MIEKKKEEEEKKEPKKRKKSSSQFSFQGYEVISMAQSSGGTARWNMQRLSPQGLKTDSNYLRAQRVFKYRITLACARAFSSRFKDRV